LAIWSVLGRNGSDVRAAGLTKVASFDLLRGGFRPCTQTYIRRPSGRPPRRSTFSCRRTAPLRFRRPPILSSKRSPVRLVAPTAQESAPRRVDGNLPSVAAGPV